MVKEYEDALKNPKKGGFIIFMMIFFHFLFNNCKGIQKEKPQNKRNLVKKPMVIDLSEDEDEKEEEVEIEKEIKITRKSNNANNTNIMPKANEMKRKRIKTKEIIHTTSSLGKTRQNYAKPSENPQKEIKKDVVIRSESVKEISEEKPVLRKKIKLNDNKSKPVIAAPNKSEPEKRNKIKPAFRKPMKRREKGKYEENTKERKEDENMELVEEIELHLKNMELEPIGKKKGFFIN